MPAQAWGSATESKGGGAADPNVLKLGDQNRVRLLDAEGPRKWRQHGIDGEKLHALFPHVDENFFRSVTCPRGPDGRGEVACPCDIKGSVLVDGKDQQLFPVSIRYAANVWDYESGTVKVLIAGKQVFQEFDAVAKVGFDPTACDFIIFRMGKDRQTSYKVVRGGDAPLPQQITPEMLHDLDKFEAPDTADRIFEILNEAGVDYDQIPLPEFTLDQAEQFVIPYTKHKGLTMEQLYATDPDYMKWLYGTKRDQGQYGDAVFQAMHTVLLHHGDAKPLDEIPKAPPRAQAAPAPTAPPPAASNGHSEPASADLVTLVGPNGAEVSVPQAAAGALLAAGYSEPKPPEPEAPPQLEGTILVGPAGDEIDASTLPEAAVPAMLQAGYAWRPEAQAPSAEPADADEVVIDIGGTTARMPYGTAKTLIAAGTATLAGPNQIGTQARVPVEPAFQWPADDAKVVVKLKVIPAPVELTFAEARSIVLNQQGEIVGDDELNVRIREDKDEDKAVAQSAAAGAEAMDPPEAQAQPGNAFDKNLTVGPNEQGEFSHPALPGKAYKTKGAVTQALNRLASQGGGPAPASPPAASAPAQPAPATDGRDAKIELARGLMATANGGKYMADFPVLLELFNEVAGKRNIQEFTEPEIDKLIERLRAEGGT